MQRVLHLNVTYMYNESYQYNPGVLLVVASISDIALLEEI